MLKYITDNEYMELLGVTSIPDNFDKLVIEASNYINYMTYGKIDENNIPEQVKYVTCLIIDLLIEQEVKLNEVENLKAENIEGWSKTYLSPQEIRQNYSFKMQNILSKNLWNVMGKDGLPLLYCGVR